jgi:hypothetical protein
MKKVLLIAGLMASVAVPVAKAEAPTELTEKELLTEETAKEVGEALTKVIQEVILDLAEEKEASEDVA